MRYEHPHPMFIVNTQLLNASIWSPAATDKEALLQAALRRLHAAVENHFDAVSETDQKFNNIFLQKELRKEMK